MSAAVGRDGLRGWLALAGFVLLCQGIGGLGAIATLPQIPTWYAALAKPSFNPPDWVFGPVWTILYAMMAIAAWLVWRSDADATRRAAALRVFAVQLALNLAWTWIFFGARDLGWASAEILLLLAAIGETIRRFRPISRPAAALLVPYLLWVAFATVLSFSIWRLNPSA